VSNDREQEFIDHVKKVVQPFDLVKLERDGVLSRVGKTAWYHVHSFKALPEHWGLLADVVALDSKGSKIRFPKGVQESAAKILKQLTSRK
jgi:hypothetical protein